jgi:tRNA (guanine-N(7)-)-methyltransferase subunit TRM82
MPKRPCAVVLTPDDSAILCADKFGDVYSLPLLGQTYDSTTGSDDAKTSTDNVANGAPQQKPFVPAATSLTVHTKGNREALRQQQKITNPKAEKKSLNFEHQLLLGHVSLLTDVVCVYMDRYHKNPRTYILSSDRDEHIRVSRGIPQAHIIEGYCLGHTEFVSKLCFSPDHPLFLLSGGGDDYLLLWEWLHGKILQKIDLRGPVEAFKEKYDSKTAFRKPTAMNEEANTTEDSAKVSIAVSNIRTRNDPTPGTPSTEIIVTCEGYVASFAYNRSQSTSC